MLFLASFILKGHSQAALVAAAMAILGLAFPPAAWISAAVIVLVTLVNGPKNGLITTALSLLGAALFAYLIFSVPQVAVVFVLVVWLPAWLVASVLRETVSLAYSLQALTAISLLSVVMLYSLVPDFGELWREPLDQMVQELAKQSDELSLVELRQVEDWVIAFLPGLFASSIMFGTMLSLLLGRWWQAVFYNPGGFAKEFQSLNLGKISALLTVGLMLLALAVDSIVMTALVTVVMVLYSIQALSLMHAVINIRQMNTAWLVLFYLVMFFMPQLLLVLMLAGIADPWLRIRQRMGQEA